jgi:hypothetical protein
MIDYQQYAQSMKEVHECLELAAATLNRRDMKAEERIRLAEELANKAKRFRALATFAVEAK